MPYCEYSSKTAAELQELSRNGDTVAVLPIGAVEQHGPHLPVGTDYISAQDAALLALQRVESKAWFLLLPTVCYALSVEHIHVPGTITLRAETLIHMLTDIGESLLRLGVKKLVLVNGHGGNDSAIQIAGRTLRGEGMRLYMVNGGAIRSALGAKEYHIHADRIETSVMMATHPDMVRADAISEDLSKSIDRWHSSADCRGDLISCWYIEDIAVNGVVGDPALASPEFGRDFVNGQADRIARALELAAEC
ncbi:MAG: creatininase family protein [Eubacteriales bacterium]|nr:creatininase family protein [Eubacteriales bacterium]